MTDEPLGRRLVDAGVISQDQLNDALERKRISGAPMARVLVETGAASAEQVQREMAEQLGLPYCELDQIEISPEAIARIPMEIVQQAKAIPVDINNGTLSLAMADPRDFAAIEAVEFASGMTVKRLVANPEDVADAIEKHYGVTVADLIAGLSSADVGDGADESFTIHDIQALAREPTLVNLVNLILMQAIQERASDIHIEPFETELKIKYRIDGVLHDIDPPPKRLQPAIISRLKIMASMDIAERFTPQDGHIRLNLPDRTVDIRVATLPTIHGESMVLRLLDRANQLVELEDLGMQHDTLERFVARLQSAFGILLVTGPTGSGKTTTLYAAMSRIYTPKRKFITIEDPVEYQLPGVVQIPVRPKRGMDFASGLRAIVRQDPDIIMVGEIRDLETADISIRAALTGHLVFSTLHTNDAPGAVTRLIDMGVEPFLVASSVEGILAQRLVRRLCDHCRRPEPLPRGLLSEFGVAESDADTIYHPEGCEHCHGRGFLGRIGVYELMDMTPELQDLVLNRAATTAIRAEALKTMQTMKQDGFTKVCSGVTTAEEVLQVTQKDMVD